MKGPRGRYIPDFISGAEAKFVQYLYQTRQIINALAGHGPGNPWVVYVPEEFDRDEDASKFIREQMREGNIELRNVPCP